MAHDSGEVIFRGHRIPSSHSFTSFRCDECPNIHVIAMGKDGLPICEMAFSGAQLREILRDHDKAKII